jgi:hypothetical protein
VTIKLFIQLGIKKSKKEGINEGNKKVLNWENWSVHILIILVFTDSSWDDYLWFQESDRKLLKRINVLIKETKYNKI